MGVRRRVGAWLVCAVLLALTASCASGEGQASVMAASVESTIEADTSGADTIEADTSGADTSEARAIEARATEDQAAARESSDLQPGRSTLSIESPTSPRTTTNHSTTASSSPADTEATTPTTGGDTVTPPSSTVALPTASTTPAQQTPPNTTKPTTQTTQPSAPAPAQNPTPAGPPPTSPPVITVPPTTPAPEPLRIAMSGDSMMGGLYPALEGALETQLGRPIQVEYFLTPAIVENPEAFDQWRQIIADYDPHVSIFLMGWWENYRLHSNLLSMHPDQADWMDRYRSIAVEPWRQLVTSGGGELIWVTMPPVDHELRTTQIGALNEAWRSIGSGERSTVIESVPSLTDPEGRYALRSPATGRLLRNPDGLHICQDGALALTERLIADIATRYPVQPQPEWQTGPWRANPAYPAGECEG